MDVKKRLGMIREAVELHKKDFAVIPVHQQMLTWGMTRKVQVIQRPDDFLELSSVIVTE
jgi:peptide/nickel transport system substrate-binding protein